MCVIAYLFERSVTNSNNEFLFKGYSDVIREPMDLSTIRHRLESNQYDNAEAYIRDFQLMFKNSKTYNTDRRSLVCFFSCANSSFVCAINPYMLFVDNALSYVVHLIRIFQENFLKSD